MRTIEISLTWPDNTAAKAILKAVSPDLGAQVEWSGNPAKLGGLPPEIAPGAGGESCDVGTLLAFSKLYSLETEGEHNWTSQGEYEIWAE